MYGLFPDSNAHVGFFAVHSRSPHWHSTNVGRVPVGTEPAVPAWAQAHSGPAWREAAHLSAVEAAQGLDFLFVRFRRLSQKELRKELKLGRINLIS